MSTKLLFMLSVLAVIVAGCLVVGPEHDSVVLDSPGNPSPLSASSFTSARARILRGKRASRRSRPSCSARAVRRR